MSFDFTGKSAIVTGAAHGFGRAISLAFAERGAHVFAIDIVTNELEDTERLCVEAGGRCESRTVDITQPHAVNTLVEEVNRSSGQVDILVNNAGGVLGQVGRPLGNGHAGGMERDFRRQCQWRVLPVSGGSTGNEGRALRAHRQHLRAVPDSRSA